MKAWNLFGDKKNVRIIYIIMFIGAVCLIFGSMHREKESSEPQKATVIETALPDTEERLAELLSQIEGAGQVSVMITYQDSGERVRATDSKTAENSRETQTVMESESGGSHPFVVQEKTPKVQGVIIVADGGDSIAVQEKLKEAVSAALGVYPHNIVVCSRKK